MERTRGDPLDGHPLYEGLRTISRGQRSFVQVARNKATGEQVAIKFIPRGWEPSHTKYVCREILNHQELSLTKHPHVVEFKEVFLTQRYLAEVMEYVEGETLQVFLEKVGGKVIEGLARFIFQQLIIALDFCHRKGKVNRDVKLSNILLSIAEGQLPLLKLCDFGASKDTHRHSEPHSQVGTALFVAPEVMQNFSGGRYNGQAADVWACGVCLFIMVFGRHPYLRPEDSKLNEQQQMIKLFQRMMQSQLEIPQDLAAGLSPDCTDLLRRMLKTDPGQRLTMANIQRHPWFRTALPEGAELMNDMFLAEESAMLSPQSQSQIEALVGLAAKVEELHPTRVQLPSAARAAAAAAATTASASSAPGGGGSAPMQGMQGTSSPAPQQLQQQHQQHHQQLQPQNSEGGGMSLSAVSSSGPSRSVPLPQQQPGVCGGNLSGSPSASSSHLQQHHQQLQQQQQQFVLGGGPRVSQGMPVPVPPPMHFVGSSAYTQPQQQVPVPPADDIQPPPAQRQKLMQQPQVSPQQQQAYLNQQPQQQQMLLRQQQQAVQQQLPMQQQPLMAPTHQQHPQLLAMQQQLSGKLQTQQSPLMQQQLSGQLQQQQLPQVQQQLSGQLLHSGKLQQQMQPGHLASQQQQQQQQLPSGNLQTMPIQQHMMPGSLMQQSMQQPVQQPMQQQQQQQVPSGHVRVPAGHHMSASAGHLQAQSAGYMGSQLPAMETQRSSGSSHHHQHHSHQHQLQQQQQQLQHDTAASLPPRVSSTNPAGSNMPQQRAHHAQQLQQQQQLMQQQQQQVLSQQQMLQRQLQHPAQALQLQAQQQQLLQVPLQQQQLQQDPVMAAIPDLDEMIMALPETDLLQAATIDLSYEQHQAELRQQQQQRQQAQMLQAQQQQQQVQMLRQGAGGSAAATSFAVHPTQLQHMQQPAGGGPVGAGPLHPHVQRLQVNSLAPLAPGSVASLPSGMRVSGAGSGSLNPLSFSASGMLESPGAGGLAPMQLSGPSHSQRPLVDAAPFLYEGNDDDLPMVGSVSAVLPQFDWGSFNAPLLGDSLKGSQHYNDSRFTQACRHVSAKLSEGGVNGAGAAGARPSPLGMMPPGLPTGMANLSVAHAPMSSSFGMSHGPAAGGIMPQPM